VKNEEYYEHVNAFRTALLPWIIARYQKEIPVAYEAHRSMVAQSV
jgi:hypothetical protein